MLGVVLFFETRTALRYLSVLWTPVKIMELDQAFTLFVALLLFLYEVGPLFLKCLKPLRFSFEKLLFKTRLHHTAWTEIPLEYLPR
jgi:hypothetical protein